MPFFVGLTFFAGVEAWASHAPFIGQRRILARGITGLWLVAAIWIGVLLLLYVTVWEHVGPEPRPTVYYLGLPGTFYHLVGLYGGLVLILASAFGRDRWFEPAPPAAIVENPT